MRKEIIRRMYDEVLYPDMVKEAREEISEAAENVVIKQAQDRYRKLLMTGPFECLSFLQAQQPPLEELKTTKKGKKGQHEEDVVKERPRYNVMGVLLQQIDQNNFMVTVAVVDKFGELVAHKDLTHLMPPRKVAFKQGPGGQEMDEERKKKVQQSAKEEMKEHEADKDKVAQLMLKHQVDLVVVGANKLDARKIKEVMKEVAEKLKSQGLHDDDSDEEPHKRSKKRGEEEELRKEAFVIWGSLEVPKLFASSHRSQRLLKNCHPNLKQAVSLARFEQDPMCELLNLWSAVPSENLCLSLNLQPLQKQANQSKLAQALEEVNVQCVNLVGVDLNLLIDHEHMHCLLQFISGLGPRKARRLLQNLNAMKILNRNQLLSANFLTRNCFMSTIPFLRVKVPAEERKVQPQDYLDLTRIHSESYMTAIKIATDAMYPESSEHLTEADRLLTAKAVMKNPSILLNLDLKQYKLELQQGGQQSMISIVDIIIEEFKHPFSDPRQYRNPNRMLSESQIFYMLIDESERTFKVGVIVTATVVKILDKKVLCKLDNGLDGIIMKEDISAESANLEDFIGHVITGRIDKIGIEKEDHKFSVNLKCKREDLERHDKFVDKNLNVCEEDLVNHNFQIEKRQKA